MAKQIGIVLEAESGNRTRVVTECKSACGGCQPSPGGCRGCLASAKITSSVSNPVGAKVGDLVEIHLSTGSLLTGTAILYILPVMGLLAGAFSGAWASDPLGFTEIFGSIGGALIGLVGGYIAVIALDRNPVIRRRIMPTITSVLEPEAGFPGAEKASCCG